MRRASKIARWLALRAHRRSSRARSRRLRRAARPGDEHGFGNGRVRPCMKRRHRTVRVVEARQRALKQVAGAGAAAAGHVPVAIRQARPPFVDARIFADDLTEARHGERRSNPDRRSSSASDIAAVTSGRRRCRPRPETPAPAARTDRRRHGHRRRTHSACATPYTRGPCTSGCPVREPLRGSSPTCVCSCGSHAIGALPARIRSSDNVTGHTTNTAKSRVIAKSCTSAGYGPWIDFAPDQPAARVRNIERDLAVELPRREVREEHHLAGFRIDLRMRGHVAGQLAVERPHTQCFERHRVDRDRRVAFFECEQLSRVRDDVGVRRAVGADARDLRVGIARIAGCRKQRTPGGCVRVATAGYAPNGCDTRRGRLRCGTRGSCRRPAAGCNDRAARTAG